jgi:hypothetical protein
LKHPRRARIEIPKGHSWMDVPESTPYRTISLLDVILMQYPLFTFSWPINNLKIKIGMRVYHYISFSQLI